MIPSDPEERTKMINRMLDSLLNAQGLTSWEVEFVASVSDYFNRRNRLSDRQAELLEKLYDKVNP